MTSQEFNKLNFPKSPGVYLFKKGKDILYIGKATSLRDRVKSYFAKDVIETRSVAIVDMVSLARTVEYISTDTALEALILEAQLIKKYTPKYNIKEKDNRSFNYVIITNEKIPKVLLIRGRTLKIQKDLELIKPKHIFGPFLNTSALIEGLRIIRKIFPYVDTKSINKDGYEFYKQLGLTPDTKNLEALKKYTKNIRHIVLFFKGKKQEIKKELHKEMMAYAKKMRFEEAQYLKKQLFSLEHINDVAVIKSDFFQDTQMFTNDERFESFDIAHMSGKSMVGVMTVMTNGNIDKSEYKKFIIKTHTQAHDTGALYEILMRRFKHKEWGIPSLVVVDGGIAQIRVAKQVLNFYQLSISVVSVLKDERHKPKDILGDEKYRITNKKEILLLNSEAHRFAIEFHKNKRSKKFLNI